MKIKLMVSILFFAMVLTGRAQTELTAEQAIELGLQHNFSIQIARNNADMAENNTGLGRAGFLPTLDVNGNANLSQSEQETNNQFSVGSSESSSLRGQVSLNWTLFDGFAMFADNQRFEELERLGKAQARNTIENTVVAILAAYFNLVQQQQLLDVAERTLEISETRLNKERVRNELGGASSVDLLNAQVAFNQDKTNLLQRQLQVEIARKDLNLLLGQHPDTRINVEERTDIRALSHDYETLLQMARESNSGLVLARQSKNVADQQVRLARSFFYPRLLFNAGYNYNENITERDAVDENSFFPPRIESTNQDMSVGLTLQFNVFNGFRRTINVQNAKIEARNQELALQDALNNLDGWVKEKYLVFQQRMQVVELERENVKAAEQNLELQTERYQVGASTSLEFRDAQLNLSRAQNTLITALFQARLSRLEIEQLVGNIEIN